MARSKPNIIVTGTPGVGKTSHCEVLAENAGLQHLRINDIVKQRQCHEGWDETHQSYIVDEDKVRWLSTFLQEDFPVLTWSQMTAP